MTIPKALQDQIKAINKKFGKGTITTASKAVAVKVKRISTGSFALDVETGGGYPEGRITVIAGPFSSGKSFTAYKAVAEAQKKYLNKIAIWVDQEGSFEKDWAEKFGIDLDRLQVVRPAVAEDAHDITLAFMQSSDISIIVVDSLAAMSSTKEVEKSMGDSQAMGGNAKMNNEFFRKAQAILNMGSLEEDKEQPAIIIINQLRSSMDQYKPEFLPGGRGQEYAASIIIYFRIGDKYNEKREGKKEPEYVGHQVKFKTEKNKTFAPKRQGTFDIYVAKSDTGFIAGDIDRLKEVTTYAIFWKVIKKAGAWFTILGNEEWKFQGAQAVLDFLRENEDIRVQVEEAVMDIAINGRQDEEDEDLEELTYVDEETGYEIDPETGEVIDGPVVTDLEGMGMGGPKGLED